MKKFVKVMLIIAAVFAAVGIGLTAGGAVMGAASGDDVIYEMGKHFQDTFGVGYDSVTAAVDTDAGSYGYSETMSGGEEGDSRVFRVAEAEKLEVELSYDELILEEHSGTGILVEVRNDPKEMVHVKEEGNTLKITSSRKLEKKRQIIISCPRDMKFRQMDIEVASGNIDVRRNIVADNLEIMLGAGEFVNSGTIEAAKAEFEVGAGEFKVTGLNAQEIDGQCGVGNLSLEVAGNEEDYSYSLECGIGDIAIGAENYGGFGKEKRINNPGATREIDLECGIGDVSVTFTEERE